MAVFEPPPCPIPIGQFEPLEMVGSGTAEERGIRNDTPRDA